MSKRGKIWIIAGVSFLFLYILLFGFLSMSSLNNSVRRFNEAWQASRAEGDTIDRRAIPGYMELLGQKSFLNGQVRLAESDSIGLLVNVKDSIIQLLVRGLPIRDIVIRRYDISPFFYRVNQEAMDELLSEPLKITGSKATFLKEPLSLKIAPKDTTEAVIDIKPDTTDFEPVFFTLETDHGIRFLFEQEEDTVRTDRHARFMFNLHDRIDNTGSLLHSVTRIEKPYCTPYVRIRLPKAEAKIVYRALPVEGLIVLKY